MPEPRTGVFPHIPAIHVAEVEVKTGIPLSFPGHMVAGKIAHFTDRTAKTGRADHGAIRAGETAVGYIVPAGMLQAGKEQVPNVGGV